MKKERTDSLEYIAKKHKQEQEEYRSGTKPSLIYYQLEFTNIEWSYNHVEIV